MYLRTDASSFSTDKYMDTDMIQTCFYKNTDLLSKDINYTGQSRTLTKPSDIQPAEAYHCRSSYQNYVMDLMWKNNDKNKPQAVGQPLSLALVEISTDGCQLEAPHVSTSTDKLLHIPQIFKSQFLFA